jgi:hypothetical protein
MKMRTSTGGQHAEAFPFVVDYNDPTAELRIIFPEEKHHREDWCLQNCQGKHAVFYMRAGFECEDDATLFLLRWS